MGYNLDDERQGLAEKFEFSIKGGDLQYFDTHEFVEIIDFFMDQNEILKAEKAIKSALIQHPNSIDILIRRADLLFEVDNFQEAEDEIDLVLELDEYNSEANELKGDLLLHKGVSVDGILFLQKALYNSEEKLELYNKIGVELIQLGETKKALQFFYKVLDEDILDESALFNITYCFDILELTNESIYFLKKYIDLNPYSQIAWHQLGVQFKELGEYNGAIWAFDYAIIIDEDFLGAFFEKAKCLEDIGKHHEAIEIYKKSLKMSDPTAWAYYRLGVAYDNLGEIEQALGNYFRAIHEDPMYGKAWYRIANSYSNNSLYERAVEYAEKSVEIEFDNPEYNSLLARLYLKLARYQDAENIYENLIALEVDDVEIWIEYAILLKSLDYLEDATEILLRSLTYFSEDAEILYRLSGSLFSLKKDLEAVEFLQEALKMDYNKKEILKINYPTIFDSEIVQDLIHAYKFQQKFL
ncbi:MAG: tetratricopeptide repeat protein [Flavobacteriales bacterium]|nr:tetratricopeptide repeat protein [Flavobacteriales bacterium]